MTRRTTPQAKTDDQAFPIRVKLAIPFEDRQRWWGLQDRLNAWLRELGPRRCALHSGGWSVKGQAMRRGFGLHTNVAAALAILEKWNLH